MSAFLSFKTITLKRTSNVFSDFIKRPYETNLFLVKMTINYRYILNLRFIENIETKFRHFKCIY